MRDRILTSKRVLVIDDDPVIRDDVAAFLTGQNYHVETAADASEMRAAFQAHSFDIVLLDLILPGTSGKVLCRHLHDTTSVGIIVVSAVDSDEERIALLELGADDYLVKPFNMLELHARMRALFRRTGGQTARRLTGFGNWAVDKGERRLTHTDGIVVALTPSEAQLMRLFLSSPGIVFDREELLAVSRIRQHSGRSDRSVDNLVRRLRRKIEDDPNDPRHLQTVWGQGYVFHA